MQAALLSEIATLWKSPWRVKDSEALPASEPIHPENVVSIVLPLARENDMRWFAIYTHSRHEKCVARQLAQRQIQTFLPLYRKVHRWNKRSTITLELPLFPNYVFVHISPLQRNTVLAVPGVLAIVGRGHTPSPLPDAEIESLRTALELHKCEPHPYLTMGERVRIRSGSMAGMEGILLRKKNELRVVLNLDLIQRSVAVEVDADAVEPVGGRPCVRLIAVASN